MMEGILKVTPERLLQSKSEQNKEVANVKSRCN